jgi:hypothetical protein
MLNNDNYLFKSSLLITCNTMVQKSFGSRFLLFFVGVYLQVRVGVGLYSGRGKSLSPIICLCNFFIYRHERLIRSKQN